MVKRGFLFSCMAVFVVVVVVVHGLIVVFIKIQQILSCVIVDTSGPTMDFHVEQYNSTRGLMTCESADSKVTHPHLLGKKVVVGGRPTLNSVLCCVDDGIVH